MFCISIVRLNRYVIKHITETTEQHTHHVVHSTGDVADLHVGDWDYVIVAGFLDPNVHLAGHHLTLEGQLVTRDEKFTIGVVTCEKRTR